MNIKNSFLIFYTTLSAVFFLSACDSIGYKKTKSNLEYRILKKGNGNKINFNDVVDVNIIRYMGDSLLYDSHKQGGPQQLKFTKEMLENGGDKYNLMELFLVTKVGDSVVVRVPMDSIFAKENPKPNFYKKGKYAKLYITILKAESETIVKEKMDQENKKLLDSLILKAANDKKTIDSFVDVKKLKGEYNKYNVFVSIIKEGNGNTIDTNTKIKIRYTGKTLTGKTFDSNIGDKKKPAFEFSAGQKSVIPGLDYSVMGIKQGSTIRIIIPSALAYGQAKVNDVLLANSILDFYLIIK